MIEVTGTLKQLAKHTRMPMSGVTLIPVSNTNPNHLRDCMHASKSLTNFQCALELKNSAALSLVATIVPEEVSLTCSLWLA